MEWPGLKTKQSESTREVKNTLRNSHRETDQNILNTLRQRQDGRYFTAAIFKGIFMNENVKISIEMSLKFAPKGSMNKIMALV